MSQQAFLYLVEGSAQTSMNTEELKQHLGRYQEQTTLTGKQLGWDYGDAAFPYKIETKEDASAPWLYLRGNNALYKHIAIGAFEEDNRSYLQVVLPDGATHGDKAKANELCKYLARHLKAELHLFNGRVMYFNPRK